MSPDGTLLVGGVVHTPPPTDAPPASRLVGEWTGKPAPPPTATRGTVHAEPAVLRVPAPAPTLDMQVGGDHYRRHGAMQPWCIIDHYGLNYWEASALSYILRSKDPAKRAEDLRKAAHYLEHQAQRIEAGK